MDETDLFTTPHQRLLKRIRKYEESQHPRDNRGRWAAAGAAGAGAVLAGLAAGGAVAGYPALRGVAGLRHLRNMVLGARTVTARRASRGAPMMSVRNLGMGFGPHVRSRTQAVRQYLTGYKPSDAATRRASRQLARSGVPLFQQL